MRRTILFVVVAVLAVLALPVIGVGQPTSSHGGSPSDVFMSTTPDVCNGEEPVEIEPVSLMPTAVSVGEESHLLAYFTSTWSASHKRPELLLSLQIEGDGFSETSTDWIARGGGGHYTGTVMWTFEDVASGDYTVQASARVGGPLTGGRHGWNLQNCALSVFVVPTA